MEREDADGFTQAADGDEDGDEGVEDVDEEDEEVPADAPPGSPMGEKQPPDVLPNSIRPDPTEPPAKVTDLLRPAQLPSNAVELQNTAPVHTEAGQGDLGVSDAGMEMHVPEPGGDTMMRDDEETVGGLENTDEGLVMGEMEPPIPEMGVIGGDKGPHELEQ